MAVVVALEPDPTQADILCDALSTCASAEVVVVDSTAAALAAIDERVPDLVLLHALIPPDDEAYLLAYLGTVVGAGHVQTISIPQFQHSADCHRPAQLLRRRLKPRSTRAGCDPRVFAADVVSYLDRARAIKQDLEVWSNTATSERRVGHRWLSQDVPWVSSVRFAGGAAADLIDVSASGARVKTPRRPELQSLKRPDLDSRRLSGLTFHLASGEEVRATGRVVRCHAGSMGNGAILYELAFCFDESVGLDLPTLTQVKADALDGDKRDDEGISLQARTELVSEVFHQSVTMQNEMLAHFVADGRLPISLRDAASELAMLNGALLEIRATLQGARRARTVPAELLGLDFRLAPRIHTLHALRRKVIERISQDDLVLVAAYGNRAARCDRPH